MWGLRDNWKILDSSKPSFIKTRGTPPIFSRKGTWGWKWEILFSKKTNGVELTIILLELGGFLRNFSKKIPYEYFKITKYLVKNLGLDITKNVQRTLYPSEYLKRTIRRSTINLVLSIVGLLLLLAYGYYLEFVLGQWGDFLSFMMFAVFPFLYGLGYLEILVEYRTLRQRLYLTL